MVACLAHVIKIALRNPAEKFLCKRRVGVVFRDVAGAAVDDLIRDLHAVRVFICMDDVEHGIAGAGAEVDRDRAGVRVGVFERFEVSFCEVDDMCVLRGTVLLTLFRFDVRGTVLLTLFVFYRLLSREPSP